MTIEPAAEPRATHEMPLLAAVADEIADDQEVADEPGLLDDLQLELQAVDHGLDGGGDGGIVRVGLCAGACRGCAPVALRLAASASG